MCSVAVGPLLVSCASPVSNTGTAPASQPSPVQEPAAERVAQQQERLRRRQQQVGQLLQLAEAALNHDRLMQPAGDNAFDWYRQVLELDELNADAHWGMHRITRRYLELAEQAFQSGEFSRAEYMLQGALQIAATPAQVEAIRAKYREQLRDKVFALSAPALSARNQQVQQQLADIARLAREKQSRLLIVARSDAEGRWIYQQMRTAVGGYRLRGNIEVGGRPRVVLIDM